MFNHKKPNKNKVSPKSQLINCYNCSAEERMTIQQIKIHIQTYVNIYWNKTPEAHLVCYSESNELSQEWARKPGFNQLPGGASKWRLVQTFPNHFTSEFIELGFTQMGWSVWVWMYLVKRKSQVGYKKQSLTLYIASQTYWYYYVIIICCIPLIGWLPFL